VVVVVEMLRTVVTTVHLVVVLLAQAVVVEVAQLMEPMGGALAKTVLQILVMVAAARLRVEVKPLMAVTVALAL
jgi:hypothetical protein